MVVFLVLFPKGGIKIGPAPLTWGYIFLYITTPFLLLSRLLLLPLRLPLRLLAVLGMLAPIQLMTIYAFLLFGIADPPFAAGNIIALFLLPVVFLLVYPPFLPLVDGDRLARYLRGSVLLAALWGIFLFFLHPLTGHYVEIPYLTVNAADYGQIEQTKHIARGLFLKLISTYNNGNLYGVATLILLPLYNLLEKVRWRRIAVKIAILLTLSRTVWAGMVLYELLPVVVQLASQGRTFPVVHIKQAGRKLAALLITFLMVFAALLFNHSSGQYLDFLFDPTLGGRTLENKTDGPIGLLPSSGVGGFGEVVYASALQSMGYTGLLALILLFVSPLLLLMLDRTALQSPTRRAALKGLVLYALLSLLDGGFDYIPMMAFYWFIYMIYLFGWPASGAQRLRRHSTPDTSLPTASPALG